MMFHRDKNVLVIATKFGTAANLVKKVKAIHRHLPEWMKIASIAIDNRTSFELTNGSQIKASSTSADAGRSEALSLLVIDEALDPQWCGKLVSPDVCWCRKPAKRFLFSWASVGGTSGSRQRMVWQRNQKHVSSANRTGARVQFQHVRRDCFPPGRYGIAAGILVRAKI